MNWVKCACSCSWRRKRLRGLAHSELVTGDLPCSQTCKRPCACCWPYAHLCLANIPFGSKRRACCNTCCCCREAWSQQVTSEQKQLAQDGAESHKSLEAARTAELAARKAALDFEARAKLALKEVSATLHSFSNAVMYMSLRDRSWTAIESPPVHCWQSCMQPSEHQLVQL